MATTTTQQATGLREALDALADGRVMLPLDTVAQMLGLPNRDAVRYRMQRGLLPLQPYRIGGRTTPLVVAAADVYALLGVPYTSPIHAEVQA